MKIKDRPSLFFGNAAIRGTGDNDINFKRFMSDNFNYISSLKSVTEKKKIINILLSNMTDYIGSDIVKKITTDNLEYALQQKTSAQINKVLKISLNAL